MAFKRVDVTDLGDVTAVLSGADAVVHMAAIPSPVQDPEHEVFRVNMLSNWNVLEAAEIHGITKIVMASSVNAIGAVFSTGIVSPHYFPIDEEHPTRAEDAYSQSKWLGEEMANAFCRRRKVQIASLRFHGLLDESAQQHLKANAPHDPAGRIAKHFWGWVDLRDAARSVRLSLENDWIGHEAFFINHSETVLDVPTSEAIDLVYPGTPFKRQIEGFGAALDISKAERVLNWTPEHSWRDA